MTYLVFNTFNKAWNSRGIQKPPFVEDIGKIAEFNELGKSTPVWLRSFEIDPSEVGNAGPGTYEIVRAHYGADSIMENKEAQSFNFPIKKEIEDTLEVEVKPLSQKNSFEPLPLAHQNNNIPQLPDLSPHIRPPHEPMPVTDTRHPMHGLICGYHNGPGVLSRPQPTTSIIIASSPRVPRKPFGIL
jgi:hypothetical protein